MKYALFVPVAFVLAATTAANAEPVNTVTAPSPYIEHVSYEQDSLATAEGISDLRSRVRHAAHRVCAPGKDTFATYVPLQCVSPTLRDAFTQVDAAVQRWQSGQLASAPHITVLAFAR